MKNYIDKENILMISTDKEIKGKMLKENSELEFIKTDNYI